MHRTRAFISLLLAALLFSSALSPAAAVTRSDLEKHQNAARGAREQARKAEAAAKRLASDVADLDQQIESIQAQANALEPKIAAAAERTTRVQREVDRLKREVDDTQAEIDETQAEYERQQGLLQARVNETYRQGTWFYLDVILGSADIGDLISRTEFVNRVIESNNDIAASLKATERSLTRAKVKLDRSLSAVKIKKREVAAIEADLRGLKTERDRAAAERMVVQQRKADLVAENKANAKQLRALADQEEAESQRIAAELARASGSGYFAGSMVWPVPDSHRITSTFGWRTHPIFGTKRFHAGVDIGAPYGTPIVAAASGKVMYAAYRGGYGNTLMLDHGNGVVTLYGHQASGGFRVGVGQTVSAGQRVGTVGSTGNSTGPHLHFEVRVNGVPKNPMTYQ